MTDRISQFAGLFDRGAVIIPNAPALGRYLFTLRRQERNMNRQELASECGCSVAALAQLEQAGHGKIADVQAALHSLGFDLKLVVVRKEKS